jgi:hypothetical protein
VQHFIRLDCIKALSQISLFVNSILNDIIAISIIFSDGGTGHAIRLRHTGEGRYPPVHRQLIFNGFRDNASGAPSVL